MCSAALSVLDEADLARALRPSIGETLAQLPGVSATSFGPVASAPVLRGLSGDRVRVLTDGIGTLDLSSAGPDHAISINPLTAERIEVLRGPAALLFGSSAIGGVVNVIDARIPRRLPDGPVGINALAQYGTAANERSANVSIDVPLGGKFVAPRRRQYLRTPTTFGPAAISCRRRCASKRRQAPIRPSARSPTSRASCPIPRPARRKARSASLMSMAG